MIAENPFALAYILPSDVYLLASEKALLNQTISPVAYQEQMPEMPPIVSEPVAPPKPAPAMDETPAVIASITTATPLIETPVAAFNYAGGNAQRFLVLVHYPDHDIMDHTHLSALENTIKRKELSLDDVAILNIAKHPGTELKALGAFFKPRKMLLLGVDSFPPGLTQPVLNQLTKLGKCELLYSFSFGEMMGNKDHTKAFWEQMKAL